MRSTISTLFILLFFTTLTLISFAQGDTTLSTSDSTYYFAPEEEDEKEFHGMADTTSVDRKTFNQESMEKLKTDPELNYKEAPTIAESLWDRFWSWIGQLLGSLFEKATVTNLGQVLLYTAGFIVLIIVVLALLKVNAFRVFYSGVDKRNMPYTVFHENIHEMDFEKLIREAIEKKEFRLGTRLVFLFALKLLSDKHLVVWDPGKTNHDYVEELNASDLKSGFNQLSFYFDYAWYGNFSVSPDTFDKVQVIFADLRTKLN